MLCFGDVTLCKHVITYMTEDLKLFCFGQCSTLAAGLNGLDDSCFEHDEERKSEGRSRGWRHNYIDPRIILPLAYTRSEAFCRCCNQWPRHHQRYVMPTHYVLWAWWRCCKTSHHWRRWHASGNAWRLRQRWMPRERSQLCRRWWWVAWGAVPWLS